MLHGEAVAGERLSLVLWWRKGRECVNTAAGAYVLESPLPGATLGSPALCVCPGKSPGSLLTSAFSSRAGWPVPNVLSDLYAMGVTECDNMLMLLGVSNKMTDRVSRSLPARGVAPGPSPFPLVTAWMAT